MGPAAGQRVAGHAECAGWAECVAVPATSLAAIPETISAIQAAALPLAGLTALRRLRLAGNVTGRRILLTGASGGVGHYVTELATAAGAEVTVVTASAERGRRLAELGPAQVVHNVAAAPGPYHLVESTGGENLALAADPARAPRNPDLVRPGQPAALDAELLRPARRPRVGDPAAILLLGLEPAMRVISSRTDRARRARHL